MICAAHCPAYRPKCTCNIFTTCGPHKGGSKPYNCIHRNVNKYEYDTINSNENQLTSSVICYSYNNVDGTCIDESNTKICHPHNGRYSYNCHGHRNYNQNSNITYMSYQTGTIIDHAQINVIQTYIQNEITQRKAHAAYSQQNDISYNEINVNEKDVVFAKQPNAIYEALDKLKKRINYLSDYKNSPTNNFDEIKEKVTVGKETYAAHMKKIENDLNDSYVDCICYSDCTAYGLWYYNLCTCNINCGCNYSDERLKTSIIYISSTQQVI